VDTFVDLATLKELTAIAEVDHEDDRYRIPRGRDATALNENSGTRAK